MYAVHPISLSEVKSIRRITPSFGSPSIVIVLIDGLTLPPLYFSNGGVRALFVSLKQVCSEKTLIKAAQHSELARRKSRLWRYSCVQVVLLKGRV